MKAGTLHYFLMFVGGGSAGKRPVGVKVGTVAILLMLVIAEVRGRSDSEGFTGAESALPRSGKPLRCWSWAAA